MLVMKFKGAVLQNQETLAEVKNRIKEQNCCSIVVVSALKGVMPRLRQLYGLSLRRGTGFENGIYIKQKIMDENKLSYRRIRNDVHIRLNNKEAATFLALMS